MDVLCSRCGQSHPGRAFQRCLSCRYKQSMHRQNRKRRFKNIVAHLFNNKCVVEGCQASAQYFELDHINPTTKKFKLSRCWARYSWCAIAQELFKCQQLCCFHHLDKTVKEEQEAEARRFLRDGYRKRGNARVFRNKRMIDELKTKIGVCTRCNSQCPSVRGMEFHHMDKSLKSADIADLVSRGRAMSRIVAELKKCQLLCRPCHASMTVQQQIPLCDTVASTEPLM